MNAASEWRTDEPPRDGTVIMPEDINGHVMADVDTIFLAKPDSLALVRRTPEARP